MGKAKTNIHEEPLWKKQRKQLRAEAFRRKLWTTLACAAGALVLLGMIWMTARGMAGHKPAKGAKYEEHHAFSRVVAFPVSNRDGKRTQMISFRVGSVVIDRPLTEKDRALKKDERVLLTYKQESDSGEMKIVDWSPVNQSPKPEAASAKTKH